MVLRPTEGGGKLYICPKRFALGFLSLIWKVYVAIVFAVFAVLFYPFLWVVLLVPSWKKSSFRIFVAWSWMMRVFCLYGIRKVVSNPLPDGPYVIVSNHSSYLDIFLMHSLLPKYPFLFMGKAEILSYPIIRTYFKGLNIPVYRKDRQKAARSFIMAKRAVEQGWSIVIFPEGTIPETGNPKMLPFKQGAFKLARSLNIPIVPITFTNNYHLFSDPENLLGPAHPGISRVYIHPHVSAEHVQSMSVEALTDHCFDVINEPLLKEYPELLSQNEKQ